MVVELKGGGASVSPRGRVADGEASPRRARACHSKDLRKLSALSSRLFPFPFVELFMCLGRRLGGAHANVSPAGRACLLLDAQP